MKSCTTDNNISWDISFEMQIYINTRYRWGCPPFHGAQTAVCTLQWRRWTGTNGRPGATGQQRCDWGGYKWTWIIRRDRWIYFLCPGVRPLSGRGVTVPIYSQDSQTHWKVLDGSTLEHRQGADGMLPVGKAAVTGGGGQPGVRLVIWGVDTGGPYVWIVFLISVGHDDDYSGE